LVAFPPILHIFFVVLVARVGDLAVLIILILNSIGTASEERHRRKTWHMSQSVCGQLMIHCCLMNRGRVLVWLVEETGRDRGNGVR